MSLFTLLEAARYLEYKSEASARGEEPHDYNTFTQLSVSGSSSTSSLNNAVTTCSTNNSTQINIQQLNTNSNSSCGGGGGGGGAGSPPLLNGLGGLGVTLQGVGAYRARSGSAASRQRTDSLSSHDESSRDHKRRTGGAGTREVHNKLEKNRRAHLKECFESLKKQLPNIQDDRKTSNLTILRSALRYIQNLKRKEREFEQQMEQLAREKISAQQRLASLKKDGCSVLPSGLTEMSDHGHGHPLATPLPLSHTLHGHTHQHPRPRPQEKLLSDLKRRGSVSPDNETTTTASECGNLSDYEGDDFDLLSVNSGHPKKGGDAGILKAPPPPQNGEVDRRPVTISASTATPNAIYQQAVKREEFKDEPLDLGSIIVEKKVAAAQAAHHQAAAAALLPHSHTHSQQILHTTAVTLTTNGIHTSQSPITFVTNTANGGNDRSLVGEHKMELTTIHPSPVMEPPRAIFTPGNQKTVLPTYMPNTGNLATLLHAANTVSYIKAPQSNGEVSMSAGGGSLTSIPLMCKAGSVVRLAPNGHIVQPLTLVQQLPGQNGNQSPKHNGTTTVSAVVSQSNVSNNAATPTLFLAQSGGSAPTSVQFKPATSASGQGIPTSMATVISQTGVVPSTSGAMVIPQNGTIVTTTPMTQLGKVQLNGTALSLKPVNQFPILSGQQFITSSQQSLKPVVVVSVPQTSTQ